MTGPLTLSFCSRYTDYDKITFGVLFESETFRNWRIDLKDENKKRSSETLL